MEYNNDISIASTPEDIFPPHFDVEKKYRGALVQRSQLQLPFSSNNDISFTDINSFTHKESESSVLVSLPDKFTYQVQKYNVPNAPLYLVPTHFIVNSCIDSLILRIHHVLGNIAGVSCEFLEYEVI
jgi:hypothetical protein